ncbi:hypothetical protein VNO78_16460 [Psophocarpus tetragonolobus]|uniref:Uncharacterized protein n=1 Tax=Psophocarpus tetragonolobus TaxID=3891 RepID=A0AAN9SH83_PSOTE
MLRNLRSLRRRKYDVFLCVVVWGVLLTVCVSVVTLLHRGTTAGHLSHRVNFDFLLSDDADADATTDTIDALDVVEDQPSDAAGDAEDEEEESILDQRGGGGAASSGYFFHHAEGVIRRAFSKSSFVDDGDESFVRSEIPKERGGVRGAFGSDDVAVEERVRAQAIGVKCVEDALFLGRRVSPLREGWGFWFDTKVDFLRKDKMLRSNLEALNPLRNPLLQDPDALGLGGLTRADKIVKNYLFQHLKSKSKSKILAFPSRKISQHHL